MKAVVGANVPDYHGKFLRHVGGQSAALGVVQGDATRNVVAYLYTHYQMFGAALGAMYETDGGGNMRRITALEPSSVYGFGGVTLDISRQVPTAAENRPTNIAVKYIIYAKE